MLSSTSSQFWPFDKPEVPLEKLGFLGSLVDWFKDFVDAVYWAGVTHGVLAASLVWIVLILLAAAVAVAIWYKKQREVAISIIAIVVGIVLWYASRQPVPRLVTPKTPIIQPDKPDNPKPWRPWRSNKTGTLIEDPLP